MENGASGHNDSLTNALFSRLTDMIKMLKYKNTKKEKARKKTSSFLLFSLMFLAATSSAQAFGVKFKISGGINLFSLGRINTVLESWEEYQVKDAEAHAEWKYLSGGMAPLRRGTDFEGELIASIHPRFSLSIGIGTIYGDKTQEKTEITVEKIAGTFVYVKPTVVSAVPLTLSGYFHFFPEKTLDLYIKAGGGYAWSKYVSREGRRRTDLKNFTYEDYNSASARGAVLQGGLGAVLNLQNSLSFFIEAGGRWSKVTGFEGEISEEETGILYYFEEYNSELEFWQAKLQVKKEAPSGGNVRNVEEAVIDFSGGVVKMGVMVRF